MNVTHTKHLHQILYGICPAAAEETNRLSMEPIERIKECTALVRNEFEQAKQTQPHSNESLKLSQEILALQSLLSVFLELPGNYKGSIIKEREN